MNRTTRGELNVLLTALEKSLGCDAGSLHLSRYSPGDGRTRYVIETVDGHVRPFGERVRRAQEMADCMRFAIHALSKDIQILLRRL